MSKENIKVTKVGELDKINSKRVRIVHISDTHLQHNSYLPLPEGDILVHSGDFCKLGWKHAIVSPNFIDHIRQINEFFAKQPHKHKIIVGGNHDSALDLGSRERTQERLTNVIYLEDSGVELEGIKFHGSPWTAQRWTSNARGFVKKWGKFEHHWDSIAPDTDVLVTHMPPQGVMDLARIKFKFISGSNEGVCDVCGYEHPGFVHWGCRQLMEHVSNRVK